QAYSWVHGRMILRSVGGEGFQPLAADDIFSFARMRMETNMESVFPSSVRCCIVGGGPAGMMLGYLLARAGIEVLVLEKHADFLRDFRGDTVHPSTLEVMHELDLLDEFL